MDFEALPPDFGTLLRGGSSWDVFGTGEVDLHAAETLERLLIQKSVPPGSDIYLHSSGGSLIEGMSLGRVIRAYGLNTHVARKGVLSDGFQHTDAGCCMSAAALAFLGGEFRFIGTGSHYGVHRFTLGEPSTHDADEAQVLSASVVNYIRSMGVNTELFSIASECPTDDIFEPPPETLVRLNVVNNGFQPAKWTIESIEGALYLKGERDTIYGIQKFLIVFPSTGRMYLYVIFDGGQNAESIMTMSVDHLVIDHKLVPLQELRVSRLNDCGRINLMYQVTPVLLAQLSKAKTIGYYLRHSEDAAMFVGYDSFHFEDGAPKLAGLLGVYFRETDPDELALRASIIS